jgi:hypothetical protein
MGARGGHRTNAYGVSLREMRESYAALQVAQRRKLLGALDAGLEDQCQRLIGTLVRLAVPQRRWGRARGRLRVGAGTRVPMRTRVTVARVHRHELAIRYRRQVFSEPSMLPPGLCRAFAG